MGYPQPPPPVPPPRKPPTGSGLIGQTGNKPGGSLEASVRPEDMVPSDPRPKRDRPVFVVSPTEGRLSMHERARLQEQLNTLNSRSWLVLEQPMTITYAVPPKLVGLFVISAFVAAAIGFILGKVL